MLQFSIVAGFATLILFLYYYHRRIQNCRNPLFTEWPLLGMLPSLVCNLWRLHDHLTNALRRQAGTSNFIGPWFSQKNCIVTFDPMNANHIMSKNFGNYVKGPGFRNIFRILGDSIFNEDSNSWKQQRVFLHSLFFKTKRLERLIQKIVQKKVETCLVPVLDDHVERQGAVMDLQDVINRFNFDVSCSLLLGDDPKSLAIDFPEVESNTALTRTEEFLFYRHIMPKLFWKLQRWLGGEKKMVEAIEAFDRFLYENIASRRAKISQQHEAREQEDDDLLTTLIMKGEEGMDDKYLRDTGFTFFNAAKTTMASALTWFFWLVATHPSVEAKILKEINQLQKVNNQQVYLHAALSEALRLYPPAPYVRRQAIQQDRLPSGHEVTPGTMIMLSLYSMGRSEELWGKDCLEFKPERWISERGNIIHIPSYKFIAFIGGPRTCLGKDLSFLQMKMVAIAILKNYHVHVVEDHPICLSLSIFIQMKYGLKVRITKRS